MNLFDKLKSYFKKKEDNNVKAPVGVYPNCWGKQDWDGEYYKFVKGENGNPSEATYNSFVKDVTRKLGKITIHKDNYICETCGTNYN